MMKTEAKLTDKVGMQKSIPRRADTKFTKKNEKKTITYCLWPNAINHRKS